MLNSVCNGLTDLGSLHHVNIVAIIKETCLFEQICTLLFFLSLFEGDDRDMSFCRN